MKKDFIYFVGCADMVKLFCRAMARNFNVHYPEEEIRLAKSNLVSVKYSIISTHCELWNMSEMLRDIAEEVILTQEKHNAHSAAGIVEYRIMEGVNPSIFFETILQHFTIVKWGRRLWEC